MDTRLPSKGDPMEQPSSSTSPTAVRPLDAEGVPIERPPQIRGRRSGVVTAVVIGILAVVAVGAAIAWRTLTGTVYGAAETIPNDADIVLTIDFMQLRDVDRVDRFISAFADPMQQHGIIDEVTDLETAMREFDDVAQEEIGFRFAEDVLSWIGRSASLAIWVPDGLFDITSPESFEVPKVMLVLQVRDQEGAQEFLDRLVLDLEQDGAIIDQFDIAGTAAYTFDGDDPVVVALAEDRFVIGESTATVREALELEAADSIAQTDEFQLLAGAIGDDPIATVYASPVQGSSFSLPMNLLPPPWAPWCSTRTAWSSAPLHRWPRVSRRRPWACGRRSFPAPLSGMSTWSSRRTSSPRRWTCCSPWPEMRT